MRRDRGAEFIGMKSSVWSGHVRGASFIAVVAIAVLGSTFACFNAPIDPNGDCKLAGTCECVTRADCAEGLDCIDGKCGTVVIDAGPMEGELGAPCDSPSECNSGICLPPGPGRSGVCTVSCSLENACPGNWECKVATGAAADAGHERLCVPPFNALCLACSTDQDCNATGDLCVTVGGAKVCGRDCSDSPCPSGYECESIPGADGGERGKQCVPKADTCECSDLTVGLGRGCKASSTFGTCYGFELCQADGTWAGCNAPSPSQEVCDGEDDDCDGLVDSTDPSIDISGLPTTPPFPTCINGSSGACVGTWTCAQPADGGAFAWTCGAAEPDAERCNGLDEDCDGVIDEDFLTAQGQYGVRNHCGACGYDCEVAIENLAPFGPDGGEAVVTCENRNGAPTCAPKQCAVGYAPYPPGAPVMCLRAVGSSCRPCTASADCGPFGDQCITMGSDPGTWCAQACDSAAPYPGCTGVVGEQGCCPGGYTCEQVGNAKLCKPEGDSCTCKPDRAGATRSCVVTIPGATCLGVETCAATGDWGSCDTSMTTVEVCDSADNNCDGVVDELFINTRDSGTYDTDEQCGSCSMNCKAQWNPKIQHAIGGCKAGPGVSPTCEIVQCTQETIAGGGGCQLDSDCGVGRVCHSLYRQCVRACSTSNDCAGGTCVNGFCTTSCTSNADCAAKLGAPSTCNAAGTCDVVYQFVNADKEPTNGCECPAASGVVDVPDVYSSYPDAGSPYVDRDCDLVDGVAASSLFVRAGASGGNGSRLSPFGTITAAVNAYNPAQHTAILVAAGSYVEQVVLKNGVKLFGGYSSDFSKRDVVGFPTLIEGPEPDFTSPTHKRGTVNAEGINATTVIAGFTIRGYDVTFRPSAGNPGKNSYAIYVKDSNNALVIANNHIVGGRGGDAAPGVAGAAGASGGSGADGLDSKECLTASCTNESQPGGAAGTNAACATANGTGGGASSGNLSQQPYQPPLGKNGAGGSNAQYTHPPGANPTLCKYDCTIPGGNLNGNPAQNGTDGTAGTGGPGCGVPTGGISGDEWVGGGGGSGANGTHATGGGGGGAGGAVINNTPTTCTVGNRVGDLGGTGGGGGAGGCGGSAGTGGGSGGGSFAVFVVFSGAPSSLPVIEANIVELGAGGNGGNGGPGGYGGAGGQGGEGGVTKLPAWCAGLGGHGGRGGNGGAGAGGGGGCGGAAWGIAGNFLGSANYPSKNSISIPPSSGGGSAGAGGSSPAGASSAGGIGLAGTAGAFTTF